MAARRRPATGGANGSAVAAACGIYRLVNANMADAIRRISALRGVESGFAMVRGRAAHSAAELMSDLVSAALG